MVLYNSTFCLELDAEEDWRNWMNSYYLPLIRRSGYFETYKILKLMQDSGDGSLTYCCQLFAKTVNDYQLFAIEYERKISDNIKETFGERCLPFNTMLKITEEGEI